MVRYLFYTIGDLTYQSPLVLWKTPTLRVQLSARSVIWKAEGQIQSWFFKIAIVSEDFTRITEHNQVQNQSGELLILTNTCQELLEFLFCFP